MMASTLVATEVKLKAWRERLPAWELFVHNLRKKRDDNGGTPRKRENREIALANLERRIEELRELELQVNGGQSVSSKREYKTGKVGFFIAKAGL